MEAELLTERADGVALLTMNRPERKNALTGEMLQILSDAWDRIDADPEIRSAVLTGAATTATTILDALPPSSTTEMEPR